LRSSSVGLNRAVANITRNNHYVPQATLKRWSHDGERVWAYRLLASHHGVRQWRPELIARLTRQTDLYTEHRGGRDVDAFETFITRDFEEPGQKAIEKLLAGTRMSPADWRCIARFVVAQDLRTPQDFIEWYARFQQNIQESLEAAIQKLPERIARQQAGSHSEDDATDGSQDFMRDVFKISIGRSQATNGMVPVRADIRSARSVWMRRVQHLLVNRAEVVCGHRWCTMIPVAGEEWPLTDHPVLRLNFNSPQEYDFGGGWGHPGSEFIMPVSPRLAVYTQVGKRHHGPIRLDAAKTRQLQQLFVERAYRWLLAREPIPWFEAFRPRTVDAERYASEQTTWQHWHAQQAQDEAEFDQT
jgi:hypothetical protein